MSEPAVRLPGRPRGPSKPLPLLLLLMMMMLMLMLMLPLAPGCSDDGSDSGPPADGQIGAACADNGACSSGWCFSDPSFPGGYCLQDCASDPACPDGTVCHDYSGHKFCMDRCAVPTDCRGGYVCDYGVCRPPCGEDKHCNGDDACFAGRCKAGCESDADCDGDLRCDGGACVAPCSRDSDCAPGTTCDPKTKLCKQKPGKALGQPCKADKDCSTGYCLPTSKVCSARCDSSADCGKGNACGIEELDKDQNGKRDAVEAVCVKGAGSGAAGATCERDADCGSDFCYYGFCMEGCRADKDCGAGGQCLTVDVLLEGAIAKYKGCLPREGVSTYPLEQITLGNPPTSGYKGFAVPPNASSFQVTTEADGSSDVVTIGYLADPDNKPIVQLSQYNDPCSWFSAPVRYYPAAQLSTLFVPNSSKVGVKPGIYTYLVTGSKAGLKARVKLHLKLGLAQKGTLDLNWVFLNLSGTCIPGGTLNASSAPGHSWFGKLRNNLTAILKTAGLKVGKETFRDLKDVSLATLDYGSGSTELNKLFGSSKGIATNSVNVFLVRNINVAGTVGGMVLGVAGGIPGPYNRHGTIHSGVVLSAAAVCFEKYGYNTSHTLAHELGHYLGLFHNQESPTNPGLSYDKVICSCPCGANLSCRTEGAKSWCRGEDPLSDTTTSTKNLMYYAAESTQMFDGNQLTPGQIRVILNSPIVGHE